LLTEVDIGIEAGGHGAARGTPLLSLVPSVLKVVPSQIPVLAAGGLVTGAHMAALLALGAAGIVVGTRFLTAPESQYTDGQRKALLDADSTRSVRTTAFDEARKTLGWPQGIDGRGLYNGMLTDRDDTFCVISCVILTQPCSPPDTVADYNRGEDVEILRSRYQDALANDDANRTVVWAGTGVGLIDRIQSAKVTLLMDRNFICHFAVIHSNCVFAGHRQRDPRRLFAQPFPSIHAHSLSLPIEVLMLGHSE
jgi:nitronate monooxygenase